MNISRISLNTQRLADALFIGIVCLNSSLAILRNEFWELLDGTGVLQWYVLAVGYVVASWGYPAAREEAPWAAPLASWILAAGGAVCAFLAVSHTQPIKWYDWAILSFCYCVSAYNLRKGARG